MPRMSPLVKVRTAPLSLDEAVADVSGSDASALATFSEYAAIDACEPAAAEGELQQQIVHAIHDIVVRHPDVRVSVQQRVGSVRAGELAIVCAARGRHKQEVLKVCQWLAARLRPAAEGAAEPTDSRVKSTFTRGDEGPLTPPPSAAIGASVAGLGLAVLTINEPRNAANQHSGALARTLLTSAGTAIIAADLIASDAELIAGRVQQWAKLPLCAILVIGGTGVGPSDQTIEAIERIIDKRLDGFAEAFQRLAGEQMGPQALLLRAMAGVIGQCLVFAIPGNPGAVHLATTKLLLPLLPYAQQALPKENQATLVDQQS